MTLKGRFLFTPSVGKVQIPQVYQGLHAERANASDPIADTRLPRIVADGNFGIFYETDTDSFWFDYNGTWIPFPGGGAPPGPSDEVFIIADLLTGDATVTLPDPASLPSLKTVVNVLVVNGGGSFALHIDPGVGLTINGVADGIRTSSNNQGYRFHWGPSVDEGAADGWFCFETAYGCDDASTATVPPGPPGVPGLQACTADDSALPFWIQDPTFAADYQVLTAASGVYNKPIIPATFVAVIGFGSGGGGGAGWCQGFNDWDGGGTGGGGGARKIWIFRYEDFPATVNYTIHPGGLGGLGNNSANSGLIEDGQDGGPSTITDPATSTVIFFVGGGLGGVHTDINPVGLGGQGGSWDMNGSGLANNVNGTSGDGGGSISSNRSSGTHVGCAECGGGAGAGWGGDGVDYGPGHGGSSLHGGAGGGCGGTVQVFPIELPRASDGGAHGSVNGGGGQAHDTDEGDDGDPGAGGVGLNGGDGGGGGFGTVNAAPRGGKGGAGGGPGGGGGGGGAILHGSTNPSGDGGPGAPGELRIIVI